MTTSSEIPVQADAATTPSRGAGFSGLRVVTFESRQAHQTARLIEKAKGIAICAPSMRELPIDENPETQRFGQRLIAGEYDAVVFMTGVGTKYLFDSLDAQHHQQH